jgi:hypothetical protein
MAALTFHEANDRAKEPHRPRSDPRRIFLRSGDEPPGVMFQLLPTFRARIGVKEIAEFEATVRAF